jgi:hypothetical protein
MRKSPSITQKPALDVIDEAVALLRDCPLQVGALYFIGTLPYILAFLYFWTDMSRGAFARDHLVEASFFVTISFCWCKFWQSLFATQLLGIAARHPLPAWNWRKLLTVATVQSSIQSTGLFILPVAALVTIPFGLACAFYQNASILALDGAGNPQDSAALRKEALAHGRRWPAQNHMGLAILSLFWLVVFLNILILILALPYLLKTLFGVDTMFSRSTYSMLNTTLFAAAAGITYLCVDPLFKAFYAVRCFHGRALSTGEDLQVQIRAVSATRFPAVAAILLLCFAATARAADPAPAPAVAAHAAEINQSISSVLNRPEFAWRAPRQASDEDGKSDNFMDGVLRMIGRWFRPVKRWVVDFFEWIGRHIKTENPEQHTSDSGSWRSTLQFFAWAFCAVAVIALLVIAWKLWLRRGRTLHVTAEPQAAVPDLSAEDLTADQLPEDAWLGLAREMIDKGDFRLALRAFYLAALAHLGERHIISIARHKSNYEYQRELTRRRPTQTDLIATFTESVRSFERAWYGMHEVTSDILDNSRANLDRIRQS